MGPFSGGYIGDHYKGLGFMGGFKVWGLGFMWDNRDLQGFQDLGSPIQTGVV